MKQIERKAKRRRRDENRSEGVDEKKKEADTEKYEEKDERRRVER